MSKITVIGNTTATPNPQPDWNQTDSKKADFIKNKPELGELATKDEISKSDLSSEIQSLLDKADTALQSYTETDPTVPEWAKATSKPTYTADEVGAVPISRTVNGKELSADIVIDIPDALASLSSDANHRTVSDTEKATWDAKSDFSGSYNDLTDKPSIPSVEGLATEIYVDNKVASIVDSSPEALNTLNELAAALGDDPNFATTVLTEMGKKVDKTTKVNGHELSGDVTITKSDVGLEHVPNVATNDQTPTFTEASELENIASGENVSTIFGKIKKAIAGIILHLANKSNPHEVSLDQLSDTTTYVKMTPAERAKIDNLGSLASKSTVKRDDLEEDVRISLGNADTALQSNDLDGYVEEEQLEEMISWGRF